MKEAFATDGLVGNAAHQVGQLGEAIAIRLEAIASRLEGRAAFKTFIKGSLRLILFAIVRHSFFFGHAAHDVNRPPQVYTRLSNKLFKHHACFMDDKNIIFAQLKDPGMQRCRNDRFDSQSISFARTEFSLHVSKKRHKVTNRAGFAQSCPLFAGKELAATWLRTPKIMIFQ